MKKLPLKKIWRQILFLYDSVFSTIYAVARCRVYRVPYQVYDALRAGEAQVYDAQQTGEAQVYDAAPAVEEVPAGKDGTIF